MSGVASAWEYTIRLGAATDPFESWVGQIVDPDGNELYACHADTIQDVMVNVASAILQVHDAMDDDV